MHAARCTAGSNLNARRLPRNAQQRPGIRRGAQSAQQGSALHIPDANAAPVAAGRQLPAIRAESHAVNKTICAREFAVKRAAAQINAGRKGGIEKARAAKTAELPRCTKALGTMGISDPETRW